MNIIKAGAWSRCFRFLVLFLVLLFQTIPINPITQSVHAATAIRVSTTGSDTTSCGDISAPCRTIQYAVNKAATGDFVLVAKGIYTYNPSADTCTFLQTRAVVCFVDKRLSIYGGYDTANWHALPNPSVNITTIDAEGMRRGMAVIAYNSTASLDLQGFTIQNGYVQGNSQMTDPYYTSGHGGGIYAETSSVVLRYVTIKNSKAIGAGLSLAAGGAGAGGGLAILTTKNGVTSELDHVVFEGNQALGGTGSSRGGVALGGGLFVYQSSIKATSVTFTNNIARAGNSSGVGYTPDTLRADALGGGASLQYNSNGVFEQVTATGNQAIGGNAGSSSGVAGGGFGGAIHLEESTITVNGGHLQNNEVVGGTAHEGGVAFGGGLMTDEGHATINRISLIDNGARSGSSTNGYRVGGVGGGGAYFSYFGTTSNFLITLHNAVVARNYAEPGSSGINVGGGGGGIVFQGVQANVIHATLADNYFNGTLYSGLALLVMASNGESGKPGIVNVKQSIISDHQNGPNGAVTVNVMYGSTINMDNDLFSNNMKETNSDNVPIRAGTINITNKLTAASPKYQSPGSPNYNYHLASGSPAINKAFGTSINVDIDGQTRPQNGAADLGADEYVMSSVVSRILIPFVRK